MSFAIKENFSEFFYIIVNNPLLFINLVHAAGAKLFWVYLLGFFFHCFFKALYNIKLMPAP